MTRRIVGPGAKCKGYEQDNGSEIVLLSDPGGRLLGRYLKKADGTLRPNGQLFGYGNQLLALLEE